MAARSDRRRPIQLHLVLPYKFDPIEDSRIREYLSHGFRIDQFQRLTDREVLVTLVPPDVPGEPSASG